MDRHTLNRLVAGMLVLAAFFIPAAADAGQPRRHTVLVDPAHGGGDSGVVADKLREKDLTLRIALLMQEEAQKSEDLQVRLTRNADSALTTEERIKTAGDARPECVISLHINAGFGKQASGYEVYFPGFVPEGSREGGSSPILKDMARNRSLNDSVRLAQQIQSALESVFPRKGRGLREAPNALLSGLSVPGLVVEIGFATNQEERQRLTGDATQRAVARALVKGLREYFRGAP